ncbi:MULTISPECIES: hypothetical protein [Vibrio harveyi group]|uniref:hypothetical protein n=1 Tax=Vibrio harveyi group TaxID=717610 RepID=UPI00039FE3EB|nr:hypothetical protein [Vibrio owensii]
MDRSFSNALALSASAIGAEQQLLVLVRAVKSGYYQKLLDASNPHSPCFHGKVGRGKSSRKCNRNKRW